MRLDWQLDTYHYDRTLRRLAAWWSVGYSCIAPADVVSLSCPAAL